MLQVQSYSPLFKVLNVTGAPVTGVFSFGHISESKHVHHVCTFLTPVSGEIKTVLWNYALKMLLFASPN